MKYQTLFRFIIVFKDFIKQKKVKLPVQRHKKLQHQHIQMRNVLKI